MWMSLVMLWQQLEHRQELQIDLVAGKSKSYKSRSMGLISLDKCMLDPLTKGSWASYENWAPSNLAHPCLTKSSLGIARLQQDMPELLKSPFMKGINTFLCLHKKLNGKHRIRQNPIFSYWTDESGARSGFCYISSGRKSTRPSVCCSTASPAG